MNSIFLSYETPRHFVPDTLHSARHEEKTLPDGVLTALKCILKVYTMYPNEQANRERCLTCATRQNTVNLH